MNNPCFSCCNWCCNLIVTIESSTIFTISKYLDIDVKLFKLKYLDNKQLKKVNNNCIFLKNNRCIIYRVRPYSCKKFMCSDLIKFYKSIRYNFIGKNNANDSSEINKYTN